MKTPRIEPGERAAPPRLAEVARRIGPVGEATLQPIGPAPCSRACPVGINVKRYVGLVAEARYEEALAVIRRDNPLAAVCGYLCNRPCELDCARAATDPGAPIPIRALKQMAARVVADAGAAPELPAGLDRPVRARVAVVGGGPSGLTAARDLRCLGYGVTVVEAGPALGGLLTRTIPTRRLPRWALDADVDYVLAHGVEARLSSPVVDTAAAEALLQEGFDAVVLAIGAGRELGLGLPGEGDSDQVLTVLTALRSETPLPDFREGVVLGATPAAFAAASTLARRARDGVRLVFHRERWALPVDPATLAEAEAAGVTVECLLRAEEIEVSDGLVTGVVVTEQDPTDRAAAGRSRMTAGRPRLLPADLVVVAGDREPALDGLESGDGLRQSSLGLLAVDPLTLETDVAGIFGTGEAVSGPRSVIEAIALGRRVARAVHRAISGETAVAPQDSWHGLRLAGPDQAQESAWSHAPDPRLNNAGRTAFGAVGQAVHTRAGDLEPAALEAARRCLRCGPCVDCATCSSYCPEGHAVTPEGDLLRAPRALAAEALGTAARTQARVDARRCRACGLCEEHCPYSAPRILARANGRLLSSVDAPSCRGCGVCVGLCPTGALSMGHFDNPQLVDAVDRLLAPEQERP